MARKHGSYQTIAEALRLRIESGGIETGRYLPTERELQEEFAASRSTIRRALSALISAGWVENVPSKGVIASKAVRGPRSRTIAMADGKTYVWKVLLVQIGELLRARGFHLVHFGGAEATIEEGLAYAVDHDFDGLIIWPFRGFPDAKEVTRLCSKIPVVTLDHRMRGCPTDLVTVDYFEAARQAAAHLIRQGRTRIGVTGMIDMLETTHERFSGYMKALFDADMTPAPRDFLFNMTSGCPGPDNHLLELSLQDADRPDALLVLQDEFVPAVVETALAVGLSLPDDLAIACIGDDIDLEVDGSGLTSVACDWRCMAEICVEMILDRIHGQDGPPQKAVVPHRLVVRGLCGAPRSQWTEHPEEASGFPGGRPYPKTSYRFRSAYPAEALAGQLTHISHRRSMK